MKKYLYLLILFMCVATGPVIAKEYTVKTGLKTNVWNDILDHLISQKMHFSYDTESQSLLWYVDYPIFPIAISLKDTVRRTLLEYIQKYKEWNRKASRKGIRVDKKIGDLPSTTIWFKYGDDWIEDNVMTHVGFFSQSPQRHQLVIYFPKLRSMYNEFITYKPDTLYFWWNEVIDLEKAISDKALKKYIDEVKKKQSVEKDFK